MAAETFDLALRGGTIWTPGGPVVGDIGVRDGKIAAIGTIGDAGKTIDCTGLTILPGSSPEISAEPNLQARPIDDASFVRPIALVKKRGRTLPAASAMFLASCKKALRP